MFVLLYDFISSFSAEKVRIAKDHPDWKINFGISKSISCLERVYCMHDVLERLYLYDISFAEVIVLENNVV